MLPAGVNARIVAAMHASCSATQVWGGLAEVLRDYLGKIKIAFRYYVLAGASGSAEEDPSSMGMSQFLTFVKGSGLQVATR